MYKTITLMVELYIMMIIIRKIYLSNKKENTKEIEIILRILYLKKQTRLEILLIIKIMFHIQQELKDIKEKIILINQIDFTIKDLKNSTILLIRKIISIIQFKNLVIQIIYHHMHQKLAQMFLISIIKEEKMDGCIDKNEIQGYYL